MNFIITSYTQLTKAKSPLKLEKETSLPSTKMHHTPSPWWCVSNVHYAKKKPQKYITCQRLHPKLKMVIRTFDMVAIWQLTWHTSSYSQMSITFWHFVGMDFGLHPFPLQVSQLFLFWTLLMPKVPLSLNAPFTTKILIF